VALQVRRQALHAMIMRGRTAGWQAPVLLNKTVDTTTEKVTVCRTLINFEKMKGTVRAYKTYERGGRRMDLDGERAIG
jgi:hypothetical protein